MTPGRSSTLERGAQVPSEALGDRDGGAQACVSDESPEQADASPRNAPTRSETGTSFRAGFAPAPVQYTSDHLNVPLLRKVLEHIEAQPDEHCQEMWRRDTTCGTTYCFAGFAVAFAGAEWVPSLDDFYFVYALPDEDGARPDPQTGRPMVHVAPRARRVLGLTEVQAAELFTANNSRERLRRICEDLADEAGTPL